MTPLPAPLLAIAFYYGFLFLTTALSYGVPYPLFGALLGGVWARSAVVADCLILLHVILGTWRRQRLTWYLVLAYNLFELASLAVTLLVMAPEDVAEFTGHTVTPGAFYGGALLAGAVMALVTWFVARNREMFANSNPYLF